MEIVKLTSVDRVFYDHFEGGYTTLDDILINKKLSIKFRLSLFLNQLDKELYFGECSLQYWYEDFVEKVDKEDSEKFLSEIANESTWFRLHEIKTITKDYSLEEIRFKSSKYFPQIETISDYLFRTDDKKRNKNPSLFPNFQFCSTRFKLSSMLNYCCEKIEGDKALFKEWFKLYYPKHSYTSFSDKKIIEAINNENDIDILKYLNSIGCEKHSNMPLLKGKKEILDETGILIFENEADKSVFTEGKILPIIDIIDNKKLSIKFKISYIIYYKIYMAYARYKDKLVNWINTFKKIENEKTLEQILDFIKPDSHYSYLTVISKILSLGNKYKLPYIYSDREEDFLLLLQDQILYDKFNTDISVHNYAWNTLSCKFQLHLLLIRFSNRTKGNKEEYIEFAERFYRCYDMNKVKKLIQILRDNYPDKIIKNPSLLEGIKLPFMKNKLGTSTYEELKKELETLRQNINGDEKVFKDWLIKFSSSGHYFNFLKFRSLGNILKLEYLNSFAVPYAQILKPGEANIDKFFNTIKDNSLGSFLTLLNSRLEKRQLPKTMEKKLKVLVYFQIVEKENLEIIYDVLYDKGLTKLLDLVETLFPKYKLDDKYSQYLSEEE